MSDLNALTAPFAEEELHTFQGVGGKQLTYIEDETVMDRLDAVCGPQGWQCRYPHTGQKTVCEIGILTAINTGEFPDLLPIWVWKADGAGDTDFEADKGALSDAFKRAAVRWGIGRYLYDLDSPWVEIEPAGKSYKIKESEKPKLVALLTGADHLAPEERRLADAFNDPMKSNKASKEKWQGPLPVTKLKDAMRRMIEDVNASEDDGTLNGVLHTYQDVYGQCHNDLPDWHDRAGEVIAQAQTRVANNELAKEI